jgi:hypothetical protein
MPERRWVAVRVFFRESSMKMNLTRSVQKPATATAQFRQWCSRCGRRIEIGTRIERDPQHGWRHAKCPQRPRSRHRDRRPTCPVCGYPIERGDDVAANEDGAYGHLLCTRPDLVWEAAVARARRKRLWKEQR